MKGLLLRFRPEAQVSGSTSLGCAVCRKTPRYAPHFHEFPPSPRKNASSVTAFVSTSASAGGASQCIREEGLLAQCDPGGGDVVFET